MEEEKIVQTSNKEKNGKIFLTDKKQSNTHVNGYDRYNYAKLKILEACVKLNDDGLVINAIRISKLLKKNKYNIGMQLNFLSVKYPYLSRSVDVELTDGCIYKYQLKKQGLSVYEKLKERVEEGLDLNLKRKNPQKVISYEFDKPIKDVIKEDVELTLITD